MSGSTQNPPKKIGVCIIVENETVPFDRRTWMEACALRDAGYDVSVICPKRGTCQEGRAVLDGVNIYRYWCWNSTGIVGHLFEYAWSLIAQFILALRVFARSRFRILHACNPPETIFLISLFFKLFGVRFVFDHHDLSPELYVAKYGAKSKESFFYRLTCAAEKLTFRTADFSIATNESYREVAIRRGGMKPEKVAVVQTCASLEETNRAISQLHRNGYTGNGNGNGNGSYYGNGNGKNNGNGHHDYGEQNGHHHTPVVVYVGTIGPQDGVDLLLESASYITQKKGRRDIRFVIVGSGSELPRLKVMASELYLNSNFDFIGRIDHDKVDSHLAESDICVAPDPRNSFTDNCSMIKIFEYMAHAKPIVLFDLKEGRRSAGEAALYARPNDPEDFAEQILKLLDSEQLRHRLGECGRRRVDETFNWEIQSKKLVDAYHTVLNG